MDDLFAALGSILERAYDAPVLLQILWVLATLAGLVVAYQGVVWLAAFLRAVFKSLLAAAHRADFSRRAGRIVPVLLLAGGIISFAGWLLAASHPSLWFKLEVALLVILLLGAVAFLRRRRIAAALRNKIVWGLQASWRLSGENRRLQQALADAKNALEVLLGEARQHAETVEELQGSLVAENAAYATYRRDAEQLINKLREEAKSGGDTLSAQLADVLLRPGIKHALVKAFPPDPHGVTAAERAAMKETLQAINAAYARIEVKGTRRPAA